MKTVKEISKITGISVRTLHYYDGIGLLKPTEKSEAGYRLYDDKALETLQQILFFREFDIPLKTIKEIMENPSLGKNQILSMQRRMLVKKKERMERLIAGIDEILKGDGQVGFEVFSKAELEELCDAMIENMREDQKAVFIDQYGSMEQWRKSFLEKGATKEVQENLQLVAGLYGGKERAAESVKHSVGEKGIAAYQKQVTGILQKVAEEKEKGKGISSPEIQELIGEYALAAKQMFRLSEEKETVLRIGERYRTNKELQKAQDTIYGEGTMEFFGRAVEAYYGEA